MSRLGDVTESIIDGVDGRLGRVTADPEPDALLGVEPILDDLVA